VSPKAKPELFEPSEDLKRALVVVAHPDDVDFGFAGTVAVLTGLGVDVAYCLVTSGDAGGDDSTHTKEERAEIRETEQTAAAKEVGVTSLHFLRWPDGQVEPSLLLRREISRTIRQHQPDLVITQSPERNYERIYASHPDHMAAGEATLRAVYPDARNPHAFPELIREGFNPHAVREVWIGHSQPNLVVDVTDTIDRKVAALRRHVSQIGDGEGLDERIRDWAKRNAKAADLGKGKYAESFRRINTA
jgi:LmbE family N-acetylglucosaminyl deacetylase